MKISELLIPQAPTNFFQTLHPSISAWTTHGLPLITSPSKMTTVLIRRNAPTDSCRNLTALMPRCTKTSFLITLHYICAHRNSDNLHNAAFKGYSLVALGMADEHLIVVLYQQYFRKSLLVGRSNLSPLPHGRRSSPSAVSILCPQMDHLRTFILSNIKQNYFHLGSPLRWKLVDIHMITQ